MRTVVDIPPEATVVVSDDGEKYHRQGHFPWEETACRTTFRNEVHQMYRAGAEDGGYEPCANVDCFGEPVDT